jgi:hypothetical protein
MHLPISIHSWGKWEELPQEKYDTLREVIPQLPEGDKPKYASLFWGGIEEIQALHKLEIEFTIDKDTLVSETGTMIVRLQDQLSNKFSEYKSTEQAVAADCAVQISIPDLGLLLIDEVTYLQDACTDTLQDELSNGWRILAVCPPNAQRRPDYILGRKSRND